MKVFIICVIFLLFVGCKDDGSPGILGSGNTSSGDHELIYHNYRYIYSGNLNGQGNKDVIIYSVITNNMPLIAVYVYQTNIFLTNGWVNAQFLINNTIINIRAGLQYSNNAFKVVVIQ